MESRARKIRKNIGEMKRNKMDEIMVIQAELMATRIRRCRAK